MTAAEIISSALSQLNRGDDIQTTKVWQDKFLRFANEAVTDLAGPLKLRRTEAAEVADGELDASTLPGQCVKVISLWRDGKKLPFTSGPGSQIISVQAPDGPIKAIYRWLPVDMTQAEDKPQLPEYCHGLIVDYVVGRERATSDPSMQRGANVYFELYQEGKRKLLRNLGESDTYKIINKW